MKSEDDPLIAWALARLEHPVDDPAGVFAGVLEAKENGGEPPTELGSSVMLLERGRPVPVLSNAISDALERARILVVIARYRTGLPVLEPHLVLEAVSPANAEVQDLRRFSTGWGMIVARDGHPGVWQKLTASEAAAADRYARLLERSRQDTTDLQRRLGRALDEQRRLVADLDEAQVRSAALEENLQQLRENRRRLQAEISDLREERREWRSELADATDRLAELSKLQKKIGSLRNEGERLRSEAAALRARRSALEHRQTRLLGDRAKLRHRLAVEKWKRRSLSNRRWWRLGRFLSGLIRRPFALRTHWRGLKELLRSMPPEPRPQPESVIPAPAPPQVPLKADPMAPPRSDTAVSVTRRDLRRVEDPRDLVVGAVLDDMSAASFHPECRLVTFTPQNWKAVLSASPPDLLFVESAWKGNSGSWEYQVGSYSHPDSVGLPRLSEVVEYCRTYGIPTVFWNKEDPVHFDKFKEAARLFDYIFTTDSRRIPAYRSLSGSRAHSVASLPFAAQPRLHYPAPLDGRERAPVFAGTFYRNRHPERREQLEMLLDGALEYGLVIYDRMKGEVTESFGYPDRFRSVISGGVPYEEMVEVYRRHRVFLNTNSVVDSPTMFSRRVFELLACGTPVVSTPSRGLHEMFRDEVAVVSTAEEVGKELDRLLNDRRHWLDVSRRGLLSVARRHLYADRLRQVAEAVGFEFRERSQAFRLDQTELNDPESWRKLEAQPTYVVFGQDDSLAWPGRILDADVVGYTDDPREAYRWSKRLPEGEFAVRWQLLAEGWTPARELPVDARVFLIPR